MFGLFDAHLADLALWERRWTDAEAAIEAGLTGTPGRGRAGPRPAVRERPPRPGELAAFGARAGMRTRSRDRLRRARKLLTAARRAADEASAVTRTPMDGSRSPRPNTRGSDGDARPEPWSDAAATWDRSSVRRSGLLSLARGRGARQRRCLSYRGERSTRTGLCDRGSSRSQAAGRSLERLAQRARLDLAPPEARSAIAGRVSTTPRPDGARGGGPEARRPWLHEPRDCRGARHQRQDGRAQARTSSASSTRRTDSKRPRSHTACLLEPTFIRRPRTTRSNSLRVATTPLLWTGSRRRPLAPGTRRAVVSKTVPCCREHADRDCRVAISNRPTPRRRPPTPSSPPVGAVPVSCLTQVLGSVVHRRLAYGHRLSRRPCRYPLCLRALL